MNNTYTPDIDTVLFEYLNSEPAPCYHKLNEWSKRYPQYAKELAELEVGRDVLEIVVLSPHER